MAESDPRSKSPARPNHLLADEKEANKALAELTLLDPLHAVVDATASLNSLELATSFGIGRRLKLVASPVTPYRADADPSTFAMELAGAVMLQAAAPQLQTLSFDGDGRSVDRAPATLPGRPVLLPADPELKNQPSLLLEAGTSAPRRSRRCAWAKLRNASNSAR